jgi:CBS domain-containing protein
METAKVRDRVGAAMTTPPIVATPDESLGEAAPRMIAARIGCLPVVLQGRLMGMLPSTDLPGHHIATTFQHAGGTRL